MMRAMGWEVDEEVNQDKNEAAQECAASIFQSQLLVLSEAQNHISYDVLKPRSPEIDLGP